MRFQKPYAESFYPSFDLFTSLFPTFRTIHVLLLTGVGLFLRLNNLFLNLVLLPVENVREVRPRVVHVKFVFPEDAFWTERLLTLFAKVDALESMFQTHFFFLTRLVNHAFHGPTPRHGFVPLPTVSATFLSDVTRAAFAEDCRTVVALKDLLMDQ